MMICKHVATNAGNIQETQLASQEATDRRLIGGIKHGSARSTAACDLIT